MLPKIEDRRQHFTNFGSTIFNYDLDASHYLYSVTFMTMYRYTKMKTISGVGTGQIV